MGCGVIPWLIAPELLPLRALPPGSALGNASNWLFNFIINTIWPQMNNNLGDYSFCVFAAINFVGLLFVIFCMPETTGKSLDDHSKKKKNKDLFTEEEHEEVSGTSGSSSSDDNKSHNIQYIETAH